MEWNLFLGGHPRLNYARLRKILNLNNNIENENNSVLILSIKFDLLKKQIRKHIFLFRLMKKLLSIILEKQFSLSTENKSERQRIERLF